MENITPTTVLVTELLPFDIEMLVSAARQNTDQIDLIEFIERTFKTPRVSSLIAELNLPMPDEFAKIGLGAELVWHVEDLAYKITLINFQNGQRIHPGIQEISTGAYLKRAFLLGEEGILDFFKVLSAELLRVEKENQD